MNLEVRQTENSVVAAVVGSNRTLTEVCVVISDVIRRILTNVQICCASRNASNHTVACSNCPSSTRSDTYK